MADKKSKDEGPPAGEADAGDGETRRARLILGLRSQGVTEPKVLEAVETTPRALFVPELFQERTWEDSALPIACGQTISQPFIVGLMMRGTGRTCGRFARAASRSRPCI